MGAKLILFCTFCMVCLSMATEQEKNYQPKVVINPLQMDIEWILQGNSIGFTGFFCELLGLSRGLRAYFPELRVGKGSFIESFSEPHFGGKKPNMKSIRSFFEEDLMPEESKNLLELAYPSQHKANMTIQSGTEKAEEEGEEGDVSSDGMVDIGTTGDGSECMASSKIESDTVFLAGDLSRRYAPEAYQSAEDCCRACKAHPLCSSWTHGPEFLGEFASLVGPAGEHLHKCSLKIFHPPAIEAPPPTKMLVPNSITRKTGNQYQGYTSGVSNVSGRRPSPRALIFHGTMCVYRNESVHTMARDGNTIYIGRYMVERGKFPGGFTQDEYLVFSCAARMDEIWVPTEWHKKVFVDQLDSMGFGRNSRIAVVPESVDTQMFDPNLIRTKEQGNKFALVRSREPQHGCRVLQSKSVVCLAQASSVGEGHVDVEKNRFRFLSVFKWERRKGWDVLLNAYWSAFTRADDVVLILRTYVPSFFGIHTNITQHIEDYAQETFNSSAMDMARIVWESGEDIAKRSDSLTRADVRDLLGSVDAFVLPTRGEGWGLPISEAMSMQLPVIVTNCTGPAAYATNDNAYLIPVLPGLDDMAFAQPDKTVLAQLMRQVVHDSGPDGAGRAQQKALLGRSKMQELSPEHIASIMADRLRAQAALRGYRFV